MHKDIIHFLSERRLKEALTQLHAFAVKTENWEVQTEVEGMQTTYHYLLQYAAQGTEDPQRKNLYTQLLQNAYKLADRCEFMQNYKTAYGYFPDKYRQYHLSSSRTLKDISLALEAFSQDAGILELTVTSPEVRNEKLKALALQHQKNVDELFDKVWTSLHWTEEEQTEARGILDSLLIPANDIAVMVSAVTLSLLKLFDTAKFQFLMDAFEQRQEPVVTLRALTGIAIVASIQEERLKLYPELGQRLTRMAESMKTVDTFFEIQQLLLLTRETEQINKKMQEEILPRMMSDSQAFDKTIQIKDLSSLEDLSPELGKNIEEISKSLNKLNALQKKGADTHMGSFSQLKSFPFFQQAAHWFYPFDKQTPEVSTLFRTEDDKKTSLMDMLLSSDEFCDSDKYSFCFTLNLNPMIQKGLTEAQLPENQEDLPEEMKALLSRNDTPRSFTICKQYIHDLYRFFKLWKFRKEEEDIFQKPLTLWKVPALAPFMQMPEKLRQTADYLLHKKYLEEATELYQRLSTTSHQNDADLWEKLGFALQGQYEYDSAIEAYQQADLLCPDQFWNLTHLGICYQKLGDNEQALRYFQKAEPLQPDNHNIQLQIGMCLFFLKDYDKALAYFFKVEYLDENNVLAQQSIARCYFQKQQFTETIRFYKKLIQNQKATIDDWLSCGAAYLICGNIPQSLECYRQVAGQLPSHENFVQRYLKYRPTLTENGVSQEYIDLIPDLILN